MDQMSKPSKQRRTHQQILQLLYEFESSKSSVVDFCRLHGISTANFHKLKSRYKGRQQSKSGRSGFAKLDITSSSSSLFAEVNGIKVYQAVSASFLKELL